ncbi:MAG: chromosome segregation protein SMC [Deltaproteobacteria bacterium]|nr:chromosome segregation protein SMC [Deltaproteobacteria bacterium]
MKLKSIEIQGFKSFDDKTMIGFDDDITCIVGPNGCGKSNIVDAIRWVMGEQSAKHLRGRGMEDVIFAGTIERPPNSLASVELTFDTTGTNTPPQYSQLSAVSIGRKLFRSGESEYYINKQPVRLKDVTDFFLGTGVGTKAYSIIEQGRVGMVVESKPEDRRSIIEEAAGISKFKARKEAALRKIESTRQNLSRLNDILTEIDRQKNTLARQAKKAEKFQVIRDELKDLDLKLASLSYETLDTEQKNALSTIRELSTQEQTLQNKIQEDENWIEDKKLHLVSVETELNDLQQDVFEWDNTLKLTETKIQTRKDDISRSGASITQMENELAERRKECEGSQNGLSQVNEKLALAELDCAATDDNVKDQTAYLTVLEASSGSLFSVLEETRESFNNAGRELSQTKTRKENITARLNELIEKENTDQAELGELSQKHKKMSRLLDEIKKDLNSIKQLKLTLTQQTDSLHEKLSAEDTVLKREQNELSTIKNELLSRESRLKSLEELERNFEGYHEGPRQILKSRKKGDITGVMSSVAEIIETEPLYETPVSAVLGERMQYLIVKNQSEGVQCAEFLKASSVGRSSFIPISLSQNTAEKTENANPVVSFLRDCKGYNVYTENYLNGTGPEPQEGLDEILSAHNDNHKPRALPDGLKLKGVMGRLTDYIKLKEGYQDLGRLLFGDVVLADRISNALEIWSSTSFPVVTMDGETISKDGIITGGSTEDTSKALLEKKREIKELHLVIAGLVQQVKSKEDVCTELLAKINSTKSEIENIRSSCHVEDVRFAEQEKDILHYTNDLKNLNDRRSRLTQQIFETKTAIDDLGDQLKQQEQNEKDLEQILNQSAEILKNKKSEEESCRKELAQKQEDLTKEKIKLAQLKEQRSFLAQEVDRLIAEQIRLKQEIIRTHGLKQFTSRKEKFLQDRLAYLEKFIRKTLENKDAVDQKYRAKKNEFEILHNEITEKEVTLKKDRQEHSRIKDDLNKTTLNLSETRNTLSRLNEQLIERYQLVLSEIYQDHKPDPSLFEEGAAQERAAELRAKIANLGNVNIAAIDELNEITQRFEFLSGQRQDLEKSLLSLERAIQKINRTSAERFKNTFEQINEKFTKLFPRLFQGGHAYLQLTDPENILETGVEIIAQPPGKKLQSMSLLSGGEKALTAVSLLFAIFLIKPSPFCLLDEVDAPLDDSNVDRYNDIVKEMSQRTQFVVITHNKRTMQVSDCLFGVTMQERGISKIVSVNLNA